MILPGQLELSDVITLSSRGSLYRTSDNKVVFTRADVQIIRINTDYVNRLMSEICISTILMELQIKEFINSLYVSMPPL